MLLDKITTDLHQAMKNRDRPMRETLRFLLSSVQKYQIDNYPPGSTKKLTDEDVVKVIRRHVKIRQEAITAFQKGQRQDLVAKETFELNLLQKYLPALLTEEEIRAFVKTLIDEGNTNFGQIMAGIMQKWPGRVEGKRAAEIVQQALNQSQAS